MGPAEIQEILHGLLSKETVNFQNQLTFLICEWYYSSDATEVNFFLLFSIQFCRRPKMLTCFINIHKQTILNSKHKPNIQNNVFYSQIVATKTKY